MNPTPATSHFITLKLNSNAVDNVSMKRFLINWLFITCIKRFVCIILCVTKYNLFLADESVNEWRLFAGSCMTNRFEGAYQFRSVSVCCFVFVLEQIRQGWARLETTLTRAKPFRAKAVHVCQGPLLRLCSPFPNTNSSTETTAFRVDSPQHISVKQGCYE